MNTLAEIAVPSNFAALRAVFRSMLPADWTQRDGFAGRFTTVNGSDEYVTIDIAGETERAACRTWWADFLELAERQGGREIIWGARLEQGNDVVGFRVHGKLFIAAAPLPAAAEGDAPQ